jgi:hypothetical protein
MSLTSETPFPWTNVLDKLTVGILISQQTVKIAQQIQCLGSPLKNGKIKEGKLVVTSNNGKIIKTLFLNYKT